jgi:hypothetical protein
MRVDEVSLVSCDDRVVEPPDMSLGQEMEST